MRVIESDELQRDYHDVVLKDDEYWHGGDLRGTVVKRALYCTKDLNMALSYVDMANGRVTDNAGLYLIRVSLGKAAPAELVLEFAKRFVPENEENGYTPASVFDENLHDVYQVGELIEALEAEGYDHTVLPDVYFGHHEDGDAVIVFHGKRFQLVTRYETDGLD